MTQHWVSIRIVPFQWARRRPVIVHSVSSAKKDNAKRSHVRDVASIGHSYLLFAALLSHWAQAIKLHSSIIWACNIISIKSTGTKKSKKFVFSLEHNYCAAINFHNSLSKFTLNRCPVFITIADPSSQQQKLIKNLEVGQPNKFFLHKYFLHLLKTNTSKNCWSLCILDTLDLHI